MASSREPLHVAGEATYVVPALAFPGLSRMITPSALAEYDAAQLFIDRAVAVQSTFKVTEQNAMALAGVCHQLDGIPLAIELAAARTRVLSVENIASRLDDRFRLLERRRQDQLPRQQTLRALTTGVRISSAMRMIALPASCSLAGISARSRGIGGLCDEQERPNCSTSSRSFERNRSSSSIESGRYRMLNPCGNTRSVRRIGRGRCTARSPPRLLCGVRRKGKAGSRRPATGALARLPRR